MCTAIWFKDPQGNFYMGRNLDWGHGYGQKVIVTPRGWSWQSCHEGLLTTRSAVIGMAVFSRGSEGLPLYFDCANEDGLMVAGLSFAAGFGKYRKAEVGRTNVASFELPLWLTTRFSTVAQVEEAARDLVITDDRSSEQFAPAAMHWIVGDKTGAIVLEQDTHGLHVYHDGFGVLTNQPGFDFHRQNMRNYLGLSNTWPGEGTMGSEKLTPLGVGASSVGLPGDVSSISRFVRAAYVTSHYPDQSGERDNITRLFRTLGSVAMAKGMAQMADGASEYTLYTSGWSAAERTYYYSTYDDPAIRRVTLDGVRADGGRPVVLA